MFKKCFTRSLGVALVLFACGARGVPIEFTATLSGAAEFPANASAGTGFADVFYDTTTHLLSLQITFSGLSGTTTASHIHAATAVPGAGTAGVATTTPTFPGFPLGVTSGFYSVVLDLTLLSSYNPAYVTANGGTAASAEQALVNAMFLGESYVNIHTTVVPGGEIRGFLNRVPDAVSTGALLILSFGALIFISRFPRLNNQCARS